VKKKLFIFFFSSLLSLSQDASSPARAPLQHATRSVLRNRRKEKKRKKGEKKRKKKKKKI
jgi:hypothetical protein